jgi:nucleoside-diphosphate-sugar epimerase
LRVLVTGANGFIGQVLFNALLVEGYNVRGVVRSRERLVDMPEKATQGNDMVVVGGIGANTEWVSALKDVDIVVHLAARAHIMKETAEDPFQAFRAVNTMGTEHLARMAADAGVHRFIYISSIGVNGEQTHREPFTEGDIPNPTRPYAVSKWEAETVLKQIASDSGMQVVILRPPLVYGSGAKGNIFKLMDYIYRGWPLPLGGIHNRRSFIGLGNLIDAIMLSIKRPEVAGQTFLVSDGEDISTPDLIRLIADYMGKEPKLFNVPISLFTFSASLLPPIRQKLIQLTGSLVVDSSKFRNTMRWTPPYSLKEGMKDMVSDYLSRRGNRVG